MDLSVGQEGPSEIVPTDEAPPLHEFVFAFTRAQGTDLRLARLVLLDSLAAANFYAEDIPLNDLLWARLFDGDDYHSYPAYVREKWIIVMGDQFRQEFPRSDGLALLAIEEIANSRTATHAAARKQARRGVAWIVRHLVHPDEVALFRKIYGNHFFLITVFESPDERLEGLTSRYRAPRAAFVDKVEALAYATQAIALDSGVPYTDPAITDPEIAKLPPVEPKYRPNLQATFPFGDLFLGIKNHALEDRSRAKIAQLVAQIVGYPFSTPDVHESGMAAAYQARVSSASLGRQVGAALISARGDLIAAGWNDVPAPGGGVYVQHYSNLEFLSNCELDDLTDEDDIIDYRDHTMAPDGASRYGDSNLKIRYEILADLIARLRTAGLLNDRELDRIVDARKKHWRQRKEALAREDVEVLGLDESPLSIWQAVALGAVPEMKGSLLSGILEYGRSVHAEMNAITTAARNGLAVRDSVLYCTTFPCHECARHIIAAGIRRCLYIEPFPKSRVFELHADAVLASDVTLEADDVDDARLGFYPFIGISPRRHEELFAMVHRKRIDQMTDGGERDLAPEEVWARASWSLWDGEVRPAFVWESKEATISHSHELAYVRNFSPRIAEVVASMNAMPPGSSK